MIIIIETNLGDTDIFLFKLSPSSEALSSHLTSTLSLAMWHGLPTQGWLLPILTQIKIVFFTAINAVSHINNILHFFAMDSIQSTVFAAVTIDGKVHVFDLHHDKYKPLCVQVLANVPYPHPHETSSSSSSSSSPSSSSPTCSPLSTRRWSRRAKPAWPTSASTWHTRSS